VFINEHGSAPKFSQRDQVPYTVSVMKECMRYRPITSFGVPHETTKDGKLERFISYYKNFIFIYIYQRNTNLS
jgi:cytochrome P450